MKQGEAMFGKVRNTNWTRKGGIRSSAPQEQETMQEHSQGERNECRLLLLIECVN